MSVKKITYNVLCSSIFAVLFCVLPSTVKAQDAVYSQFISNSRYVINVGYTQNTSKFVDAELNKALRPGGNNRAAVSISAGKIIKNSVEAGVCYRIGRSRQLTRLDKMFELSESSGTKHNFGVYSNYYLTSLIKNENFPNNFSVYTSLKLGGYYVQPNYDRSYGPYGLGFNFYVGLGLYYYFSKNVGIFSDFGYDYYPLHQNYVTMSKVAFSAGFSIRI